VGSVGSGKSTLAIKMAKILDFPVYHLDEIVHEPASEMKIGNIKHSDDEIDLLFRDILKQDNFIIEDCLRERFTPALQQVDNVIFLDLPRTLLFKRVLIRWFKQKLRLEKVNYRPTLQILRKMLSWIYEGPVDKVINLESLIVLHNKKEINKFLETLK
jgi:adenylate kinase family enzyme